MDLPAKLSGDCLKRLPITYQDGSGPASPQHKERVVPQHPLTKGAEVFPGPRAQRILLEQNSRRPMCSPPWPPKVGDWKQRPNEARHPVVGVSDMMKNVKANLAMQPTRLEIGTQLPEVGVKLNTSLEGFQTLEPGWKAQIDKVRIRRPLDRKSLLSHRPVERMSEYPSLMEPRQLIDNIPSQNYLSAPKLLGSPSGRAGKR